MEANSVREFKLPDGIILPLTVVRVDHKYLDTDTTQPQLVKSYELRAIGSLYADTLTDVLTDEELTVTRIYSKLGFTYITVQEKNMVF